LKIFPGKTTRSIWLRGTVVCCSLAFAPWLCLAQTAQNAALSLPDAPNVAQPAALDDSDLPPAPEPSGQQAESTSQNQPNRQGQPQQAQPQQGQSQQTPSKSGNEPSLSDLGFTPQQTEANAKLQALLNRRTEMLKIHQRLGLITTLPMAAAVITGPMAKAKGKNGQTIKEPTQANLDFHAALGGATTGLYIATAYYAMFAPKVPGSKRRGAIRLHRALAFVHGPGMIATPILGAMAFKQEQAGEKVHGIASAHGTVAWVTVAAYGAAIVSVSWPIKLKF
jgi:hypothetical protein